MDNISDLPQPKRPENTSGIPVAEITKSDLIVFGRLVVDMQTLSESVNFSEVMQTNLDQAAGKYYSIIERIEKRGGILIMSQREIQKLEKQINYLEDFLASEGYEGTDK